jgi:hypothetical protein
MEDDCLKLSVYLVERRRTGDGFVSDVLLGLYQEPRPRRRPHRLRSRTELHCRPSSCSGRLTRRFHHSPPIPARRLADAACLATAWGINS